MPSPSDTALMREALAAARVGLDHGAGPFGATIADGEGRVLAVGVNSVLVANDPTAHAEVVVIRKAAAVRRGPFLRDCTLATTCAPCVMCAGAIHWSGIRRVIAGARTVDAEAVGFVEGPIGFDAVAFLRARGVEYVADVQRDEAIAVLRAYRGPVYNG
jgi:tRNA(Arg) A34 adenosine deaminase TadA